MHMGLTEVSLYCEIEANEIKLMLILKKAYEDFIILFQNAILGIEINKIKVVALTRVNSLFKVNSLKYLQRDLQSIF